jgi:hypothetical protein
VGSKSTRDYIARNPHFSAVSVDRKCETFDFFDVKGIPGTFIIDKQGAMPGKDIGPCNWKSLEVKFLLYGPTLKQNILDFFYE